MEQTIIDKLPDDLLIDGDFETREIHIDGKFLRPEASLKVINHSPDGFNWGYGGSGPAQLALAILLKYLPEDDARRYYQDFKWNVIAKLPREDFEVRLNLKQEIEKLQ